MLAGRLPALAFLLPSWLAAAADVCLVAPFANRSGNAELDWIGESLSETIRDALRREGLAAVKREEREEARRRLTSRPTSALTAASLAKLADAVEAACLIYGRYDLIPSQNPAAVSRGSLRITARILDRRRVRLEPEFAEIGALEDLATLQTEIAWQVLHSLVAGKAPAREDFLRRRPPVRVDAIESYVRGLLSSSREQRHRWFAQAARLDPRYSPPCFELGRLQWEAKNYSVAAGWLERVDAGDPNSMEAGFLLGLCRYQMGDYEGARKAFQLVADTLPSAEVLCNLGAAQSRLNLPQALENLRKALGNDPGDPDYHFNTGYLLWKKGEFAEAADSFRAALDRKPDDQSAILLLGRCLKKSGPRPGEHRLEGLERLKDSWEPAPPGGR